MTNPASPPPGGGYPPYSAPDGDPSQAHEEEAPKKGRGLGKKIGGIVLALVVAAGIFAARTYLSKDPTADAKTGDCISATIGGEAGSEVDDAKVVECGSADAQYKVIGRVENNNDPSGKACEQYVPQSEQDIEYFMIASEEGKGYQLCLLKA